MGTGARGTILEDGCAQFRAPLGTGGAQARAPVANPGREGSACPRGGDLPTPKPIDEQRSLELKHLAEDAVLRAVPQGDEGCANCLYYLNPDEELTYCWHPKLRILVGGQWWCQRWEAIPG